MRRRLCSGCGHDEGVAIAVGQHEDRAGVGVIEELVGRDGGGVVSLEAEHRPIGRLERRRHLPDACSVDHGGRVSLTQHHGLGRGGTELECGFVVVGHDEGGALDCLVRLEVGGGDDVVECSAARLGLRRAARCAAVCADRADDVIAPRDCCDALAESSFASGGVDSERGRRHTRAQRVEACESGGVSKSAESGSGVVSVELGGASIPQWPGRLPQRSVAARHRERDVGRRRLEGGRACVTRSWRRGVGHAGLQLGGRVGNAWLQLIGWSLELRAGGAFERVEVDEVVGPPPHVFPWHVVVAGVGEAAS